MSIEIRKPQFKIVDKNPLIDQLRQKQQSSILKIIRKKSKLF